MTAPRRATRQGMAPYVVARIRLWGHDVGAVAEDRAGAVTFEYEEAFRRSALEISPLHLPLSLRGPVAFPQLRRIASFAGLPGVLADALPDAFGNAIIARWFAERGTPDAALGPVQKLLYIGTRAMGALEFHPAIEGRRARDVDEALAIARLVEEARRVIEGDPAVAVPEMMRVGASAGGARAKALVLWNRESGRVKSAFAPRHAGDEHWMIKFDGVSAASGGHALSEQFAPGPWGRIEYAYSELARAAGIEMSETRLLREREYGHFMVRRYDRDGDVRRHRHSLGGMHHVDYNERQALSYEDWFRTIRRLGMGQPAVDQAYRRMVFNLAARNQDDHVKNIEFMMGPDGAWGLAPAFDLVYSVGGRWARTHQMTANGKDDDFTLDDLRAIGAAFDVPRDGAEIVAEVDAALDRWPGAARAADVPPAMIAEIGAAFRRFV